MNLQKTSRTMFGLIMLTVSLVLAACGSGDSDATPTATTAANAAVPTLPAADGTAVVAASEISEDDLTVVTPELPATSVQADQVATADVVATSATPAMSANVLTSGTPTGLATAASPDSVDLLSTPSNSGTTDVASASATPAEVVEPTAAVSASPQIAAADGNLEGQSFDIAGDGTGGSGQPGERSSNIPGEASPVASPVSLLSVEGCDVPNVPAFTGTSTAYVTTAEVNFRSGPGIDCPAILEAPLAEGVAVTVLGGPVTQSADDTDWVQIEVDGVPGWVSVEFVEPAE